MGDEAKSVSQPKIGREYAGVVTFVSLAIGFCVTEGIVPEGVWKKAIMYFAPVLSAVIGYFLYILIELLPFPKVEDVSQTTTMIKLRFYVWWHCLFLDKATAQQIKDRFKSTKVQRINAVLDRQVNRSSSNEPANQ